MEPNNMMVTGMKETTELMQKSIAVSGGQDFVERLYRRAEKISAAVILVTKAIKETDSLRMRARELSIGMITTISSINSVLSKQMDVDAMRVQSIAKELGTIVRLMAVGGNVSAQNATVLFSALSDLALLAARYPKGEVEALVGLDVGLSDDDFSDAKNESPVAEKSVVASAAVASFPVQQKAASVRSYSSPSTVVAVAKKAISKQIKRPVVAVKSVGSNGGSRAEAILDVLAKGDLFGISEIGTQLPEFSPKMIQRELLELVEGGRVEKIGEKRWSQYRKA